MPLQTITLAPGVNAEVTSALGQAQVVASDLIRWKAASNQVLPEKLGGYEKYFPTALGSSVQDLHAWEGLNDDTFLAAGCTASLDVITDGVLYEITPRTLTNNPTVSFTTVISTTTVTIDDAGITASAFDSIFIMTPVAVGGIVLFGAYQVQAAIDSDSYTITAASAAASSVGPAGAVPSFATTSSSPIVTVTLVAHGYSVGESFPVLVSTAVGGVTLVGSYLIQTVPSADTFTIIADQQATSTTSGSENGGLARIMYFIGIAPLSPSAGYGVGTYGDGAYGIGIVPSPSPGTAITTTNWTLDNWGEILLACPQDGAIYEWSPESGITNAIKIIEAPLINGGIFVAQPAQILVAWGSSQDGVQDRLTIHWSDAGDYQNWTVSSQTEAGGYRLPTGSRCVGGMAGPSFNIIWTDIEVWSMDYIEPPLIYGFNSLGSGCGLAGPHAATVLNSVVYWASIGRSDNGTVGGKICSLTGETVSTVPCSVWDVMFSDLDTEHADLIVAASNSLFDEVAFYFPSLSGGTSTVDSYIKFNPSLGTWDYGRLPRSAWIDSSPVGPPVGASPTGFIYQHEISRDADGQPLMATFTTGFFQIAEGEELMFCDWILPDFKFGLFNGSDSAIVQVTVNFCDYPNATVKTQGPFSMSSALDYVNCRLRGRFVSLTIFSTDLGSWWRMGAIKVRSAPDGKR